MKYAKEMYGLVEKNGIYTPEWWSYEFFTVAYRSGNSSHSAISNTYSGLSMGYDIQGNSQSFIGFSGGYEYRRITPHDNNRGIINSAVIYAYGMRSFSDFYSSLVLLGGYDSLYDQRHLIGADYDLVGTASRNNFQFSPQIGLGYDLYYDWALIEPYALFDFVLNFQSGYQENHAQTHGHNQVSNFSSALYSQIGVRSYQSLRVKPGVLGFKEFVAYRSRSILESGTHGTDVLSGLKYASYFYTGVEFEFELLSQFHWTLQYNLDLGSGSISQNVQTTLAKAF